MSFDKPTRNKLASMVGDCRHLLTDDIRHQLQAVYGLQPDGTALPVPSLAHLDERGREVASALRLWQEHLASTEPGTEPQKREAAFDRLAHETAFTVLNRLAALRMCEERGHVIECVRRGMESDGFVLYERFSEGVLGGRGETYRIFLERMFAELAVDLGVLFDLDAPQSLVFPRERCLEEVLSLLNRADLVHLWKEDETIGWIYQYFNSKEEREAMREASAAPQNSRELAVRNQFFTPRYVVEFLVDNTLGRIWYEMRHGDTALKEGCRYLVRRPKEIFLNVTQKPPSSAPAQESLSQDELLNHPAYIPHRAKRDPRTIKILDPAVGSGHFLLYAFDLLEAIYQEAWEETNQPTFEATGKTIREEYPDLNTLRIALPELILRHNLHGIDIDLRACQIAALALWLRTQQAYQRLALKSFDRPKITRSNIVCAEPMPGEQGLLDQFLSDLQPKVIGQLVQVVFEKMKLAGEAGSLLKIGEEIADAVAEAKRKWLTGPKPEQGLLFADAALSQQGELDLDFSGITDEAFWERAEELIYTSLQSYAEQAENGHSYQRRLFADDAARGFAFIDLCRKYFDVVLMNPPFGQFSKQWKQYAPAAYPNSYNDILGAFVDRWLHRLLSRGRLGAITSRTCFFLTSFADWRRNVVLSDAALSVVADLGQGVMDDAMVEAAVYVLERSAPQSITPFLRAITQRDRERCIDACLEAYRSGKTEQQLFLARQQTFHCLPDTPFVYWVSENDLDAFTGRLNFEPEVGEVRQGLSTSDDPRFVRAVWEVPPENTAFVYYPTNGTFCKFDDPVVQSYFRWRERGTPRWAYHVKSGASQPWYSPITVKVNWHENAKELRTFTDDKGKARGVLRNEMFYFKPGFSWTRRAARFYPYVVPANCIGSASRYMAFPRPGREYEALGVCASRIASAFMRFYGEMFERPNFLVENLKMLPWPECNDQSLSFFREYVIGEVNRRRCAYQNHEPFNDFLVPTKVYDFSRNGQALAFEAKSLLGEDGEYRVAKAYGLTPESAARVERDLVEALAYQRSSSNEGSAEEVDDEDSDFVTDDSEEAQCEALVSYLVGCAFGRWDICFATCEKSVPELRDPFSPLPICPPGLLQNEKGLPLSEDDFHHLKLTGDWHYPLDIPWDGILAGGLDNADDIVRRVREALMLIWKERAEAIEQEACEILEVKDLREYFRKPSLFFADHLRRYSKSRRQAPLYWPLSTASGSYTLWIYYHRLNDDSLYTALNKYVKPKIDNTEKELRRIESELPNTTGREASSLRAAFEETGVFLDELRELRDELARVADLPYKPNLNDGVLITASPLWKLFRLSKWRKDLQDCWKKLESGNYDWAHLAYSIWPDRVRDVCKRDRSIAAAHDLESLCELVAKPAKKKRSKKIAVEETVPGDEE